MQASQYFSCNDKAPTEIYTLSLHDALPDRVHGQPDADLDGAGLQAGQEHSRSTLIPTVSGGTISAAEVAQILRSSGMTIEQLLLSLIPQAQKYAIPPISNFFVGAVALGATGSIYLGANFEFAGQALSFSVHGEQAATANAVAHGETGMQMLAVSAAPCGYCRQFLYELTTASTLQVLVPNTPPALLTDLIPDAFGPADLGVTAALMSPQSHGMTLSSGAGDPVVQAAPKAANTSY